MKKPTRSERIKERRKTRIMRAINTLEGKNINRNKMSKGNRIVLLVIVSVFIGMNFFSMRYRAKTFDFSKEEFKSKYEFFLSENTEEFYYDKNIKEIIKNKSEYSFLQNSSLETSSLIAVYQYEDKVKKVGVIGIPKDSADFEKAYIENIALVISLIMGKKYFESVEYIKTLGILDENNHIIKHKERLKIKSKGFLISFTYKENSLIFIIENE